MLRNKLDELLGFTTGGVNQPPRPREVLIVEISPGMTIDAKVHVRQRDLRSVDEYAARFQELLDAGFSWINLSFYGLIGDAGVVGVELPSSPSGAPRTSINFSGPENRVRDAAWDVSAAMTIEEP